MSENRPPPRYRVLHKISYVETGETRLRLLLPGNFINYVRIGPGILSSSAGDSEDILDALPLPADYAWKYLRIFQHAGNGELNYEILYVDLPGILEMWHPTRIEYIDLLGIDFATFEAQQHRQLSDNIVAVTTPPFPGTVIAKVATWLNEIGALDEECRGYKLVRSHNIGPKVLGHIVEEGRGIGIILEKVEGEEASKIDHLEACKTELARLHKLGLQHGKVGLSKFIFDGEKATIIDFEDVKPLWDEALLKEEVKDLEDHFLAMNYD